MVFVLLVQGERWVGHEQAVPGGQRATDSEGGGGLTAKLGGRGGGRFRRTSPHCGD